MTPIFTETEENGTYHATLQVTTDNGVSIREDFYCEDTKYKAAWLRELNDRFAKKLSQINNKNESTNK